MTVDSVSVLMISCGFSATLLQNREATGLNNYAHGKPSGMFHFTARCSILTLFFCLFCLLTFLILPSFLQICWQGTRVGYLDGMKN